MSGETDKSPDKSGSSGGDDEHILFIERLYPFSRHERPVHCFFIVLIALFLFLGFAGLFGEGTLSNRVVTHNDYDIEYQRFMRVGFPTEITVTLKQVDGEVDIRLNSDYLHSVEILHVTPYPKEVRVTDRHIIYTIQTGGAGPVIFYISPKSAGNQSLEVEINSSVTTINQLIYF